VSRSDLPFEFMLNALRLKDGFALRLFSERTGLPMTIIEKELRLAQAKGWLERDLTSVKPSVRGYDFLNDLQSLFLPGQD
jgi:oxygen-independent coproporphyrinogen-3 oxidase